MTPVALVASIHPESEALRWSCSSIAASVAEVEELAPWGTLSGATTNPSLLAREGSRPAATIRRICELLDGPVSAEAVSETPRELAADGSP